MLLSLRIDHKEHLSLLFNQSQQVIIDFCKLAIDFLQNGPNLKLYTTASQKLEVSAENIQNCLYGLLYLLMESCKHKLSEVDFRDSVLTVGFTQEQQSVLSKFYLSKRKDITELLAKLNVDEPHFHDLNWRFEVQVASRSLLQQVTPMLAMDLVLKNENNECDESYKHILLQTDPSSLIHITDSLEKALQESRSQHSRRIQRAFNN